MYYKDTHKDKLNTIESKNTLILLRPIDFQQRYQRNSTWKALKKNRWDELYIHSFKLKLNFDLYPPKKKKKGHNVDHATKHKMLNL